MGTSRATTPLKGAIASGSGGVTAACLAAAISLDAIVALVGQTRNSGLLGIHLHIILDGLGLAQVRQRHSPSGTR